MSFYKFSPEDARRFGHEQGIPFKQVGNELRFMSCPYCRTETNDKNTFAINLDTGQFKCLRASCGAQGNMLTISKDFNFSLGRDVDEYYQRRRQFKNLRSYPRPTLQPAAVAYLERRGISKEVTEAYEISVRPDDDSILVFPFYDENNDLQFIKYRNTAPKEGQSKEWCKANCKPILFGMNHCDADKSPKLIMTEGQIDSLSVAEAFHKEGNVVSVPTGAKGFTWVPYCWDFLCRFETLVVFGDHENGHITLLDEMSKRFHGKVMHVREEDYQGCKDANELLQAHGAEAVRKAVDNAVSVDVARLKRLADIQRKDMTQMKVVKSGLPTLDRTIGGFFFGTLTIITGERGKGKSTLASQFAAYAIHQRVNTLLYSGELMDWMVQDWIERQVAGREYINSVTSQDGFVSHFVRGDCLPDIEEWLGDYAYVYDNSFSTDTEDNYDSLTETLEKAIKMHGSQFIVIDNLMTAIDDDMRSDLNRQQTAFVRKLALMAKKYDVVIILIAHPRKAGFQKFSNDDVSGSGNITNLADIVLRYDKADTDDNDPMPAPRALQVLKNRLTGRLGDNIPLWFEEPSKRISEDGSDFNWDFGWKQDQEWEDDDDIDDPFM